jgi:hypothetical protein
VERDVTYVRKTVRELSSRFPGVVKLVRREMGITAFGVQIFELPPDASGPLHSEALTGQEELYVNLGRSGWIQAHEERLAFGPDTLIFVAPCIERQTVAGPDGLTYLCVGAPRGGPYRPPDQSYEVST